MLRWIRVGALIVALTVIAAAGALRAQAAERVDLLLALAADVSRSVDEQKFRLQRSGYAAALVNPRVLDAIQSGPNGKIAVIFIEWSGAFSQRVVIDWTVIGDKAAARTFADQLIEAPRSFADRTSISGAIDFAMTQLEQAPFEATRRTIDVSGDGTNNAGRDLTVARDAAVAKGVTINGLAILSERPLAWNPQHTNPPGGLTNYFRDNVIGGPGAFVIEAQNFEAFGNAIINKLVAEIAQGAPRRHAKRR